jgi:dTDP-4-dehydrorhamnose reductase
MKILIIGATGMLGYSLFRGLNERPTLEVYGTVRSIKGKEGYFNNVLENLIHNVDVNDISTLDAAISEVKPHVVINCIGLIKQLDIAKQHVDAISINALLPHRIAKICERYDNTKLIHFSTDCVFSGDKGGYSEADIPDAQDLYGKSKHLGEINYPPHLTLRTSIIGHELSSNVSLVDWFLSQEKHTKGFSGAIFSGLPTCVIARILADRILPNDTLTGLYHLGGRPIDKLSLLQLISSVYNKEIDIKESTTVNINRSLNSDRLWKAIKLEPPCWGSLVNDMYSNYKNIFEGMR